MRAIAAGSFENKAAEEAKLGPSESLQNAIYHIDSVVEDIEKLISAVTGNHKQNAPDETQRTMFLSDVLQDGPSMIRDRVEQARDHIKMLRSILLG